MAKLKRQKQARQSDATQRLTYLLAASEVMGRSAPTVGRLYNRTIMQIGRRVNQTLDSVTVKRRICKACFATIVPGASGRVRTRTRREPHVVVTCDCRERKRFLVIDLTELTTATTTATTTPTPTPTLTPASSPATSTSIIPATATPVPTSATAPVPALTPTSPLPLQQAASTPASLGQTLHGYNPIRKPPLTTTSALPLWGAPPPSPFPPTQPRQPAPRPHPVAGARWTNEEDTFLQSMLNYNPLPWYHITSVLPHRTRGAIGQRIGMLRAFTRNVRELNILLATSRNLQSPPEKPAEVIVIDDDDTPDGQPGAAADTAAPDDREVLRDPRCGDYTAAGGMSVAGRAPVGDRARHGGGVQGERGSELVDGAPRTRDVEQRGGARVDGCDNDMENAKGKAVPEGEQGEGNVNGGPAQEELDDKMGGTGDEDGEESDVRQEESSDEEARGLIGLRRVAKLLDDEECVSEDDGKKGVAERVATDNTEVEFVFVAPKLAQRGKDDPFQEYVEGKGYVPKREDDKGASSGKRESNAEFQDADERKRRKTESKGEAGMSV